MMIEVDGLWTNYGRFDAVRGLSLSVPEGSAFALVGPNGAGKTSTIKTMMNIIAPSRGNIAVMGKDSRTLRAPDFARIGYVSENQELPERQTVGQFLAYLRPFYPSWDVALEEAIIGQAQLPRDRRIRDLSHGMRAKLALTCALSFRPELLILDEPFSGLDPLVRDEFMDVLLGQGADTTMLISSHELAEIEGVATHIGFIDRGELLFQESMDELAARVRQVHVVLGDTAVSPPGAPPEWLDIKAAGSVLSFVDTRFDEDALRSKIAAVVGPVDRIDVRPIELRTIFTTIARSIRKEAA